MTNTLTSIPNYEDTNYAIELIEGYAKKAADTVKECLSHAGLNEYVHFLDTMYHYTRYSGEKCAKASRIVEPEDVKKLFREFDEEEADHYKMALKDLEAFGMHPYPETPYVVKAIDEFWESLEGRHYNAYLGILYIFENIAKHVQPEIKDFLERLHLNKTTSRWIGTHAEADIEHGEIIEEMLKKHLQENPRAAVEAARQASALFSSMMLYAFDFNYGKMKNLKKIA